LVCVSSRGGKRAATEGKSLGVQGRKGAKKNWHAWKKKKKRIGRNRRSKRRNQPPTGNGGKKKNELWRRNKYTERRGKRGNGYAKG